MIIAESSKDVKLGDLYFEKKLLFWLNDFLSIYETCVQNKNDIRTVEKYCRKKPTVSINVASTKCESTVGRLLWVIVINNKWKSSQKMKKLKWQNVYEEKEEKWPRLSKTFLFHLKYVY